MKKTFKFTLALLAFAALQSAHADQLYQYTESFTNPEDSEATFTISGTFTASGSGVLTSVSAQIFENGNFLTDLIVETIGSDRAYLLSQAMTYGLPLEIDGYFIGPAGNRNTITSCGQVFLNGPGCSIWNSFDSSIRTQGLTDVRTEGSDAGGAFLSSYSFNQTGALQISAVPEPGQAALLLAGAGVMLPFARRRRALKAQ